jgi:hypothetical protein
MDINDDDDQTVGCAIAHAARADFCPIPIPMILVTMTMTVVVQKLRVVLHLFTGSLAGIGKLPALAGWYIWFSIVCTVRFGGSSIL